MILSASVGITAIAGSPPKVPANTANMLNPEAREHRLCVTMSYVISINLTVTRQHNTFFYDKKEHCFHHERAVLHILVGAGVSLDTH